MDTTQLDRFIRVAELGSLSGASNELFITSQALSKQVSSLEKELGFALFNRTNQGVELTDAGRAFLGYARSIVGLAREAVQQGKISAGLEQPKLTLGVYGNATVSFLPAVVPAFSKLHPDVDVSFFDLPSHESLSNALINQQVDAVMTIGNSDAQKKGITYLPLGRQRPRCCIAADDELAERESIALEDLRGKAIVVMAHGSMHWSAQLCRHIKEHEPDIAIVESPSNNIGGMLMRKPNAIGVGIPLIIPSNWKDRASVLFRPPENISSTVSIDLAVRNPDDPVVVAFAKAARSVCRRQFSDSVPC